MSDEFEIVSEKTPTSLFNPPMGLAGWMVGLGSWGLILGFLNLAGMAYPGDLKISWAGFLTVGIVGEGLVHNTSFHPVSDSVFLLICGSIAGMGIKALNDNHDSGFGGWARGLIMNSTWLALFSTEDGGWERTIGAWCMLVGLMFYLSWGILYTAWVDPGVYSVFAALFVFGYALSGLPDYHDAPVPKE